DTPRSPGRSPLRRRDSRDIRRWRRRAALAGSGPTGRASDPSEARSLVFHLALELPEMLARHVDPVFLGRQLRRERDVLLPLRHGLTGIRLLVDDREVVHRARVLAAGLDDATVFLRSSLVDPLVLVDLTEPHARLDGRG